MISYWLSKVGSSIPRGFSRRYILDLLKQQPMTGKEIIDKAIVQSEGKWRPSPGLIYPMLGRLLNEELVEELDNGRYTITKKGMEMVADLQSTSNILQKQMDIIFRIGNIGKFMAKDLIDRATTIGSTLSSNLDKMTDEEQDKYKQFLKKELRKLDSKDEDDDSSTSTRQTVSTG
jgi:DNA-binding PadR family transcriptional regulator